MKHSLKAVRKATGMTQKEVAEKTGIALGTLRRWEQGVNEPDIEAIIMLAELYESSTDDLLGSHYGNASYQSDNLGMQPANLTAREQDLLDTFRALDERGKITVEDVARSQRGSGQDTGIQTTQAS